MDDEDDLKLIRQIVASDGRKYTAGNIDRSRYDRLVDLGWLTPFKTNISDVEYQVTEKGRCIRRPPTLGNNWRRRALGALEQPSRLQGRRLIRSTTEASPCVY
jgi:DUF3860-like